MGYRLPGEVYQDCVGLIRLVFGFNSGLNNEHVFKYLYSVSISGTSTVFFQCELAELIQVDDHTGKKPVSASLLTATNEFVSISQPTLARCHEMN